MLVLTNRQILTIFEPEKPINKAPLYFPKRAGVEKIKAVYIDSVENRETLHPIDKIIFFACLAGIQSGGGFATVSTLYRQITGKEKGVINISNETRAAIVESLQRLSGVILQPYKIPKGKKSDPEKAKAHPLLVLDETEKGFFIKSDYINGLIKKLNTARTIPPEMITPYKNKSIKMLMIEYDLIARAFYLHKRKYRTKTIKQDITLYCKRYGITDKHKSRLKPFLQSVLSHLQQIDFIKSFTFSGDEIIINK